VRVEETKPANPVSWKEPQELEAFLAHRGTGLIFKHSTRCSISGWAHAELERFVAANPEAPVIIVLAIESRPVARAVAEKLGIPHASPQAILVRDGRPVWNASHEALTAEALAAAWRAAPPP
jgi:bacillithiol system protein YtxJ